MANLIFLDTETTSLNRRERRIWDISYIKRLETGAEIEEQFYIRVDLSEADPMSLKIGKYYDRHPAPHRYAFTGTRSPEEYGLFPEAKIAAIVARDFQDAIIVGAVPSFDEETLADMLYRNGLAPTWHYHMVDVETLAAGHLKLAPPWNFDKVLKTFGLEYDEALRHTAAGDARMVRDLYDAVMAS